MPLDPYGADLYLNWQSDLVVTPSGNLQLAVGFDRIRQRIIRRMITNPAQILPSGRFTPADYIFEQKFGLGLGALVDQPESDKMLASLEQHITAAVLQDDNIDTAAPPVIKFYREPSGGLYITIGVTTISGAPGQIAVRYS